MNTFTSIKQLGDLKKALEAAKYVTANPFADKALGQDKTALLVFFNNSLRTRLSTQKAALNLGGPENFVKTTLVNFGCKYFS